MKLLAGNSNRPLAEAIGASLRVELTKATVHRFADIPEEMIRDKAARAARLVREAIGEAPPDLVSAYRFLLGLNSHDLSAMRELLGFPREVVAVRQWNGGKFLTATFAYDG